MGHPHFYPDTKITGESEQLICFIQNVPKVVWNNIERSQGLFVVVDDHIKLVIMIYDPLNGTLERLTPIDDPNFTGLSTMYHRVAANRKLVLIFQRVYNEEYCIHL